jgi:hypothetical protein
MTRDGMPEWAKNMDYETLPSWIQEHQWKNCSESASGQAQPTYDDRALSPVNPELDQIYGKLCHIAESLWLNHKADVCDEYFFDVGFDDDYLMTSPGARRVANEIFRIFGL